MNTPTERVLLLKLATHKKRDMAPRFDHTQFLTVSVDLSIYTFNYGTTQLMDLLLFALTTPVHRLKQTLRYTKRMQYGDHSI
jgi:hypothetical protein